MLQIDCLFQYVRQLFIIRVLKHFGGTKKIKKTVGVNRMPPRGPGSGAPMQQPDPGSPAPPVSASKSRFLS